MMDLSENGVAPVAVLLVEDEPMLRRVVAVTLRGEGLRVIEAGDGDEALPVLQSDAAIDLLLTDVRMPGMDGFQLAEASLSLRPSLPIILMTGYADQEMPRALRDAAIGTLRKPFDFASLGAVVREAVSGRAGGARRP